MASNYLDLQRLVFEEFFKISPSLLSKYASITDQLLYLILIPHILIVITLIVFANSIVKEHSGIKKLIMITGYIWIVVSGFYSTIAAIASVWFAVLLPAVFFLYIFFFFVPWTKWVKGSMLAGSLISKPFAKSKELETLKEELKKINEALNMQYNVITNNNIDVISRDPYFSGNIPSDVYRDYINKAKDQFEDDTLKEMIKEFKTLLAARDKIIKRIDELEKENVLTTI